MTLQPPLVCVDPGAPVVACVVCGAPVHTCERDEPIQVLGVNDYRCPVHPDGCEVGSGRWTCSSRCFETWSLLEDFEHAVVDSSIEADVREQLVQRAAEWRDEAPTLEPTAGELRSAAGLRIVPKT